jgi:hypothetical protein
MSAELRCRRRLALILILLLIAATAFARTKKTGFVDDDWNPIERGRSYTADPGYEFYIQEALDLAGVNYDLFEIHVDDGPPNLPTLADLDDYPLVIWNCAAESEGTLDFEERQLIRAYRELGGKVLLCGQGILDGLDAELAQDPGNPEIIDFIEQQLGLDSYWLNTPVTMIIPPLGGVPYLDFLPPFLPDYSGLPDDDPDQVDLLFPGSAPGAFFQGELPSGQQESVSTDRYLLDAIHFQSFMPEAIADPVLRGEYLTAVMSWLGYEGDELLDFMNDSDLFSKVSDSPLALIEWSPLLNAMAFDIYADDVSSTIWRLALTPTDNPCDWRIGFSHQLQSIDAGAGMVLLELLDDQGYIRLETQADPGDPGLYDLRFRVELGGNPVFDNSVNGLAVGDRIRCHLIQQDSPLALELRVLDPLGNLLGAFMLNGIAPDFSLLQFRSVPGGEQGDGGTNGWIDDYFLEGCLASGTTQAGSVPFAAPRLTAHPNPFNPQTQVGVELSRAGHIAVTVHDLAGRQLRTLDAGWRESGHLELSWDGRDADGRAMGSGVYLLRVAGSAGEASRKLVLLK